MNFLRRFFERRKLTKAAKQSKADSTYTLEQIEAFAARIKADKITKPKP